MMEKKTRRRNSRIRSILVIVLMLSCILTGGSFSNLVIAEAAQKRTVNLRFISTTDLHGCLTTKDYELGGTRKTGGLSRAYTLIEQARQEIGRNNSFTFDIGDVLYDYTTDYIYEHDETEVQPIYETMADIIGYDAITLGNHEFDYGKDYIINQMEKSGLQDICVVSNLFDSKTGQTVFHENMILTKDAVASDGTKVEVKVGIIGQTIPILSIKRENYTGIFETEDIVISTKKQAEKLKQQGADLIVVIAHSGIGVDNPEENAKNVTYELTKIPEVDVVLGGHAHQEFPSTKSASQKYYELPNVDKTTGLVNGKNLVMSGSNASSIGVADVTLTIDGNNKTITNRKSQVLKVSGEIEANAELEGGFAYWEKTFQTALKNIIGTVADGETINNYLGLIQDTSAIQLLNDSKINYALKYVNTDAGSSYRGTPIVAASNYSKYGQNGADDYVRFSGDISEPNLAALMASNKYLFLYEITGKQLREWLEWSASAYETVGSPTVWTDGYMQEIQTTTGLQSLVKEEWLDGWESFYIFDGIEYTIDPSKPPRYDHAGKKINESNRITSLTTNGSTIGDSTMLILAREPIKPGTPIIDEVRDQYLKKGTNKANTILAEYVKSLGQTGKIKVELDYNWGLQLPSSYQFIVRASTAALSEVQKSIWYQSTIDTIEASSYFIGQYKEQVADTIPPHLVLASTNENKTNRNIKITMQVTDESGISELKYLAGDFPVDSSSWGLAKSITGRSFEVSENGIYTVYAKDNAGNAAIDKISVGNINTSVLQVPYVKSYTNRMSKIKGTAEANAVIYFETPTGTYSDTVAADGTFAYALPPQKAKSKISLYVTDSTGRKSDKLTLKVKRTGPNAPIADEIDNTMDIITGDPKDDTIHLYAVIGSKVYVDRKGGKEAYQACEKYNENKTIVKTNMEVDETDFAITIPPIKGNVKVKLYSIDHIGRVSRVNTNIVEKVAPNAPVIYSVTEAENVVYGRILESKESEPSEISNISTSSGVGYEINVNVGGSDYEGVTDADGYYQIPVDNLTVGEEISVYATDRIGSTTRESYTSTYTVKEVEKYVKDTPNLVIDELDNYAMEITGSCGYSNREILLNVGGIIHTLISDINGEFQLMLGEPLPADTKISAIMRKERAGVEEGAVQIVALALPTMPQLQTQVNNTSTSLTVTAQKDVNIIVSNGTTQYTQADYTYNEAMEAYVYEVEIEPQIADTTLTIYAANRTGNSETITTTVIERIPEAPIVNKVNNQATTITGSVHLVSDSAVGGESTVQNTQTQIFAKIDQEVYEGVVLDDGSFTITIPAQKAKTIIEVWGKNLFGDGKVTTIKVVKAKNNTSKK